MNNRTYASPSLGAASSFAEADALRLRLQQIAARKRIVAAEQRIDVEQQRRLAEWSAAVRQYMATERRCEQLLQLAAQQERSQHFRSLLQAANLEAQRSASGLRGAIAVLEELSGTNISRESMRKINSATVDRYAQLSGAIASLLAAAAHLDQGAVLREFQSSLGKMVLKLDGAASTVKFLSEKTIAVSSDVLMAKLLRADADDAEADADTTTTGDGSNGSSNGSEQRGQDEENISPIQ